MAETVSDKASELLAEAVLRLQGITRANGYQCDIGQVVDDEPTALPETEESGLQLCVFLDGFERPSDDAIKNTHWRVNLIVVAKATAELSEGFRTRLLLASDVERALAGVAGWPRGTSPPKFEECKFINRATGLQWTGAALRFFAHVARPRA